MNIGNFLDLLKLRRLNAFRRRRAAARTRPEQEPALRAELFSTEQMEQHGRALAGQHRLSARVSMDSLLARLDDNEAVLTDTCERLTDATRKRRRITPAAEWLLDNFYLIEEQIRIARRHLPKGYSRELPRLASGPSAGLPRVYDIALEAISHGDGRVDAREPAAASSPPTRRSAPLRLGELWAIPIMLRLALIENLRRVAARVMADWRDRGKAARWADSMTATAEREPKTLSAGGRRHGALGPADDQRLRRRARAPAAGPERGAGAAADLDRAAPGRRRGRPSSSWCTWRASSRPPTRSRSATASAACACWRRSTGASSSRR